MSTDSDRSDAMPAHDNDRARELARAYEIAGLPRPPIEVLPLGYAPVDPNRSRVPLYSQFLAGFFFPIAYLFAAGGLISLLPSDLQGFAAWGAFLVFLGLIVLIRVKANWTGFLPGVLAMIFGVPLLAAGVCAIILVGGGFHF